VAIRREPVDVETPQALRAAFGETFVTREEARDVGARRRAVRDAMLAAERVTGGLGGRS
jgi:hypothetical protein